MKKKKIEQPVVVAQTEAETVKETAIATSQNETEVTQEAIDKTKNEKEIKE